MHLILVVVAVYHLNQFAKGVVSCEWDYIDVFINQAVTKLFESFCDDLENAEQGRPSTMHQ